MSRGTRAVIDLSALRHNLETARQRTDSRIMAVVKANGYGHGLERVVGALTDADGFAVATLCEAERARGTGARQPILLLEGITSFDELARVRELDLELVVHSDFQVEFLRRERTAAPLRVWLKVDTGMHRLGFSPERAGSVRAELAALDNVHPEVVLMSHLANADDLSDEKTRRQLARFLKLKSSLDCAGASLANSAGLAGWPDTHFDWIRSGIFLYGGSPLLGSSAEELGLRPAMTLKSTIIAINHCERGDAIGYGSAYRCPRAMPVGVVAIGYGDGYPRHAASGTPVLIGGRRCPVVGRISMDMLNVDLSDCPEARVGDDVILWGKGLPIEEIAADADTVPYELMCSVTQRVPAETVG